jgi:hypothetical protein
MTPKQVLENLNTLTKEQLNEYTLLYPVQYPQDGDDLGWWEKEYGADYNSTARKIFKAWKSMCL